MMEEYRCMHKDLRRPIGMLLNKFKWWIQNGGQVLLPKKRLNSNSFYLVYVKSLITGSMKFKKAVPRCRLISVLKN